MKKAYSMPTITVEELQLDHPIAAGCDANFEDINSLMELDYFSESCKYDVDLVDKPDKWDTICYHSNVQIAFSS